MMSNEQGGLSTHRDFMGAFAMNEELRPIGPGRYACRLAMPWGQEVPAELIVATRRGWRRRPESRDARWAAFAVGPVVLALFLKGTITGDIPPPTETVPTDAASPLRWPIPAEWN